MKPEITRQTLDKTGKHPNIVSQCPPEENIIRKPDVEDQVAIQRFESEGGKVANSSGDRKDRTANAQQLKSYRKR